MKCLIVFLIWSTLIYLINAQECLPVGDPNFIGGTYNNYPIYDNHAGVVATITIEGLTEAFMSSPYLEISNLQNNELTISVTEEFQYREENTQSPGANVIVTFIQLTCGSTTASLIFRQLVNDINSPPIFLLDVYRYSIPMPFPKGIDITHFGDVIIARDIDITDSWITFESSDPNFRLINRGTVDELGKNHAAGLEPTRSLHFTEPLEFVVTATDSGGLTATATVIIEIDEENSLTCRMVGFGI